MFLAAVDPSAAVLWSCAYPTRRGGAIASVAVAPQGELGLVGSFHDAIDFGHGELVAEGGFGVGFLAAFPP